MNPELYAGGIVTLAIMNARVRDGKHCHWVDRWDNEQCAGGDSDCHLFSTQLEEAVKAWTVLG